MLWLYRLLFPIAVLVLAPRYLLRMRRRGGYAENFGERFGRVSRLPPKRAGVKRVWMQAVSVGEMLAIEPILRALHADGGIEVYLTTTTSTGYRLARERYPDLVIGIGYFPLDWLPFSRRAWAAIRPDLAILTEGERWPEHLASAERAGVRTLCINARLSDRSYRRLLAWRSAAGPVLGRIGRLLAGSQSDAARFLELGFPPGRLEVSGNIKLDVTIPPLADPERDRLVRALGLRPGLVVLGSSTWPGEEAALVESLRRLRDSGIAVSLLLVPRHAERRDEIAGLLSRSGFSWHLRTNGAAKPESIDVAVADTTGELRQLTQLADVVFVGKSLPPHTEGQTPVEAAALHRPILFGPGMGNFRQIAPQLVAAGAARIVADPAALTPALQSLLESPAERSVMAGRAAAWHKANQGAVARTLDVIRADLVAVTG
jgi:3-deoxy-D-manno-octulosonic-acid transferase